MGESFFSFPYSHYLRIKIMFKAQAKPDYGFAQYAQTQLNNGFA